MPIPEAHLRVARQRAEGALHTLELAALHAETPQMALQFEHTLRRHLQDRLFSLSSIDDTPELNRDIQQRTGGLMALQAVPHMAGSIADQIRHRLADMFPLTPDHPDQTWRHQQHQKIARTQGAFSTLDHDLRQADHSTKTMAAITRLFPAGATEPTQFDRGYTVSYIRMLSDNDHQNANETFRSAIADQNTGAITRKGSTIMAACMMALVATTFVKLAPSLDSGPHQQNTNEAHDDSKLAFNIIIAAALVIFCLSDSMQPETDAASQRVALGHVPNANTPFSQFHIHNQEQRRADLAESMAVQDRFIQDDA